MKEKLLPIFTILLVHGLVFYFALPQIFAQKAKVYNGSENVEWSTKNIDSTKKAVIIIADNEGTEMFDLMAPFYNYKLVK